MPYGTFSPIPHSPADPRVIRAGLMARAEEMTRRAARLRNAGRELEAQGAEIRAADARARAHEMTAKGGAA